MNLKSILKTLSKDENYLLIPLFIIYAAPIFFSAQIPNGDGLRYWGYAQNITNGFYAYDISNEYFLWNGPGWPAFLSIFVYLNIPAFIPAVINCIFIFLSSKILFRLGIFLGLKKYVILFSIYFIFLSIPETVRLATQLYTEPICIFILLTLFKNLIFRSHSKKYLIINSFLIAFLILTKVVFFYIILVFLILILIYNLFIKSDIFKFIAFSILSSFILISPYLFYTHKLTGEYLYFANSGGDIMYWSSNPNISELGQWKEGGESILNLLKTDKYSFLDNELLYSVDSILVSKRELNHSYLSEIVKNKSGLEIDLIKKKLALQNIFNDPLIFTHNIIMNSSRLFLGFPYYLYFKPPYFPLFNTILVLKNAFFLFLFFISILIHYKSFNKNKMTENLLFIFLISYLSITVLLANQSQRFLLPILPFIVIYISYIFKIKTTIKIK